MIKRGARQGGPAFHNTLDRFKRNLTSVASKTEALLWWFSRDRRFGTPGQILLTCAKENAEMASISKLTPEQVSVIKARILRGDFQHRIAADYDLNQGRISEIAKGKRFADVRPAKLSDEQWGASYAG